MLQGIAQGFGIVIGAGALTVLLIGLAEAWSYLRGARDTDPDWDWRR